MTTEIKPRIVDGEPVCDSDCPQYPREMGELRCHADRRETAAGAPCVEALRRQRDEARREVCETRSNVSTPLEYAMDRGWSYLFMALCLALLTSSCGAPPGGLHLSTGECLDLAEKRDGALLAGKILAGVGGVAPLAAVPDEVPEGARWGVGAGAATTAAVGVAVIWYGERKGQMFEAYCTEATSEPSTGDGGVEK